MSFLVLLIVRIFGGAGAPVAVCGGEIRLGEEARCVAPAAKKERSASISNGF